MTQLYTAGYEGKTAHAFIAKLRDQSIKTVIDIRQNPISRKPGFSSNALKAQLNNMGIEYLHFQELGTPKPLRDFLAHTKNYPSFFAMYRQYLLEYSESLLDVLELGKKKRLCMMCFEKDVLFCHRKIIAEMLKEFAGDTVSIVHM